MRVLGVCGGNGVILFPFKKYLIGNIEPRPLFKTPNNEQWRANFGDIPLLTKYPDYSEDLLRKAASSRIDLIIGAPDCGDSSVLSYSRRKKLGDPKVNPSLNLFFKMVDTYHPRIWVMENLPALTESITPTELSESFPEYDLIFHMKSVSAWGNSQLSRIRLLIIGILKGEDQKIYDKLARVRPVKSLMFTGELTKGLVYGENAHVREDEDEVITMYAGYKISIRDAKTEWQTTRAFKKRWEVTGANFTTAPGVYRNLEDEYPATARKANRQFNPKGEMMSPRELARIQGVPDRFVICMDNSRLNFYINKGRTTVTKTPPMEIPIWLKYQLKSAKVITY